jgi:NAD(P)H-flavin reductase
MRITDEIPGVRTYEVAFEDRAVRDAFRFAPGQFNMLHLPGIGEAAISISSDRRFPATLSHTVRAVGNVTAALSRLDENDCILVRGPFGTPWPLDAAVKVSSDDELIFVAGGLGLASLRTAILDAAHDRRRFGRVVVIHGAKTSGGLLYAREYDAWRTAGIELELIVDDPGGGDSVGNQGWRGATGTVVTALERLSFDPAKATIFCCGPDAMMAAVGRLAVARGVGPAQVFFSLERNMACAVGHCGLCQFGPEFVCKDGPVFPYDRIARFLALPRL